MLHTLSESHSHSLRWKVFSRAGSSQKCSGSNRIWGERGGQNKDECRGATGSTKKKSGGLVAPWEKERNPNPLTVLQQRQSISYSAGVSLTHTLQFRCDLCGLKSVTQLRGSCSPLCRVVSQQEPVQTLWSWRLHCSSWRWSTRSRAELLLTLQETAQKERWLLKRFEFIHIFFAMYSQLQVQRIEGMTIDEFRYLWTTNQSNAQDKGWDGGVSRPAYQGGFVPEGKQWKGRWQDERRWSKRSEC